MKGSKAKHIVMMKVTQVDIPVDEIVKRITIEWKRGQRRIQSRGTFELAPGQQMATPNESFFHISQFEFVKKYNSYEKKLVHVKLKGYSESSKYKKTRLLGERLIDISQYVG